MDKTKVINFLKTELLDTFSKKPLHEAVLLLPCQHRVNEASLPIFEKEKESDSQKTCPICHQSVKNAVPDQLIRKLTHIVFNPSQMLELTNSQIANKPETPKKTNFVIHKGAWPEELEFLGHKHIKYRNTLPDSPFSKCQLFLGNRCQFLVVVENEEEFNRLKTLNDFSSCGFAYPHIVGGSLEYYRYLKQHCHFPEEHREKLDKIFDNPLNHNQLFIPEWENALKKGEKIAKFSSPASVSHGKALKFVNRLKNSPIAAMILPNDHRQGSAGISIKFNNRQPFASILKALFTDMGFEYSQKCLVKNKNFHENSPGKYEVFAPQDTKKLYQFLKQYCEFEAADLDQLDAIFNSSENPECFFYTQNHPLKNKPLFQFPLGYQWPDDPSTFSEGTLRTNCPYSPISGILVRNNPGDSFLYVRFKKIAKKIFKQLKLNPELRECEFSQGTIRTSKNSLELYMCLKRFCEFSEEDDVNLQKIFQQF